MPGVAGRQAVLQLQAACCGRQGRCKVALATTGFVCLRMVGARLVESQQSRLAVRRVVEAWRSKSTTPVASPKKVQQPDLFPGRRHDHMRSESAGERAGGWAVFSGVGCAGVRLAAVLGGNQCQVLCFT